jgi:hypothetical protein
MRRSDQRRWSHGRPKDFSRLLERNTDLSAIRGKRALVLLDEQNLTISAQDLGYRLDYGRLANEIRSVARAADLHLFTAVKQDDDPEVLDFERLGYSVHAKTIRRIPLPGGRYRSDANIDNLFAFWTGLFAVKTGCCQVLVLGSGDYGLAGELAQAVKGQSRRRLPHVMTLSLPGSTSQDLDARTNPHIKANLEIGLDLMGPISDAAHRLGA